MIKDKARINSRTIWQINTYIYKLLPALLDPFLHFIHTMISHFKPSKTLDGVFTTVTQQTEGSWVLLSSALSLIRDTSNH